MKRKNHVLLFTILTGIILWLTMVVHIPLDTQSGDMPPAPTRVGKNFRVEHLTPEEGLPSLTVWSIVQDQQGFMWFATNNGLSRYDGYTFKTFHNDPHDPHSISIENLDTLYVDRQGVLWVGTWNGGLNVFDRTTEQFTRYLHDPDDPYSLSHNRVNVIFEDKSGRLWLGTDGGLDSFDRISGQFLHYQHDPKALHSLSADVVKTIVEDTSGHLWVGTLGGGLNKFDRTSGQFTRYQHDPQNPNSLIYDNVEALAVEATGSLWIGTMAGLDYFDPATGQFTHYRHDPADPQSLSSDDIFALYVDASGDMWIGTSGGGLNIFDPQTKTFTHVPSNPSDPYGFHGDRLSSIYADQSGALWIATKNGGVNRLDRAAAKFELYQHDPDDPNSLSPGSIWSILRDHSGTLWVASVGGGLNKLDPVTGHFQHYRHNPADPHSLGNDSIFAMTEDATGVLWVGTKEGLNRFDRMSEQFTRYTHDPTNPASLSENWVSGLYADRSGRLWVGTIGQGLDLFDPATGEFRHYQADPANPHSLSDNNVLTFAEDPSGQLWIGTISGGLNKFDPETGTFIHYVHDPDNLNNLISDNVAHIYLDPAGMLWLATPAGLDKFDPQTETFTHYAEQQGLASKAIASVVGDAQGNLWVGMQGSGLARFDPGSETFKNYGKSDGLQSNNFMSRAAYRDANGKLYFGGPHGLNAFYPDQLRDNPYIPPVVLTDFQIFNHPVPIGGEDSLLQQVINETDEITLSYWQSVFSFEFAALNYRAPEKNQYAYKLEGFDADWNYVDSTRRFATYTNLDPGTYTFRVKASNNDGVWNEKGKAIKITITPPWWEMWWFYTLCVAGVFVIFGAIYRSKVRQLHAERAAAQMLRESEERLREIASNIPGVVYQFTLKPDGSYGAPYISEKAITILDLPSQEIMANPSSLFERVVPEDRDGINQTIVESARTMAPWYQEFRIRHKDGKIKWIRGASIPHALPDGKILWNGVLLDITERKQMEEALRENEEKYRILAENSPIGIFISDAERFIYANRHFCRITGFSSDELLNMPDPVGSLFAPEERKRLLTYAQSHLSGSPTPTDYEARGIRKDGKEVSLKLIVVPIILSGRRILQGTVEDITERKQAEEQIKNQNLLLEQAVQEKQREMEAMFERLLRQEKLATIGQIAGSIAHELRNPLGAVENSVFFLTRLYQKQKLDASNPKVKEHLDLIGAELDISERAISDLLQMTRMKPPQREQTDLHPIIVDAAEHSHLPENIHLTIKLQSEPFIIWVDPGQLRQVFINILTNAVQAIEQDGNITIRATQLTQEKSTIIEIENDGLGIEPDALSKVFEPLYTTKAMGTGLGLSICRQIIENHQGQISVSSQVGQGTIVTIIFPSQDSHDLGLEK